MAAQAVYRQQQPAVVDLVSSDSESDGDVEVVEDVPDPEEK